jgi:hypothetical protein
MRPFMKEECYLNNQFGDNLFDNHILQRKKWYWHGNHSNRDKVKNNVGMREKVVAKVVTKWMFKYHFSL